MTQKPVDAVGFESRRIYDPPNPPHYACWVCMFPGERGQWYIAYEEVTRPDKPLPQCTPAQWAAIGLTRGYDKSQYLMEGVILESTDELKTWREISRKAYRYQHTIGLYGGCARTRDGRFLRFSWPQYCIDGSVKPNEILEVSEDDGKMWRNMGAFHDPHFTSSAHRLRTLRDGTLVLCMPLWPLWPTPERPSRICRDPNAASKGQMTLWFSFDQGRTWDGPLPIYGGQTLSETDFVELPSGDLLMINNSIFAFPGRQVVYREGRRFTPGPFEHAGGTTKPSRGAPNVVPETVCMTEDGILVGFIRQEGYCWSDDLGRMWHRLDGVPQFGMPHVGELYQPCMNYLGDNRIVCAGHSGGDDPISSVDGKPRKRPGHSLYLHFFTLRVHGRTRKTSLLVERDKAKGQDRWPNAYTLTLLCDGEPLAGKAIEFWYVEKDEPGCDPYGRHTIEERMAMGGKVITTRTGRDGKARVDLPHLDKIEDPYANYQLVARFNADRRDPDYQPAQSLEWECRPQIAMDPPLEE